MSIEIAERKTKFLVDAKGRRTHAVVPIKEYEELLEDIHDLAIIASRRDEGTISLEELKRRLYGTDMTSD